MRTCSYTFNRHKTTRNVPELKLHQQLPLLFWKIEPIFVQLILTFPGQPCTFLHSTETEEKGMHLNLLLNINPESF